MKKKTVTRRLIHIISIGLVLTLTFCIMQFPASASVVDGELRTFTIEGEGDITITDYPDAVVGVFYDFTPTIVDNETTWTVLYELDGMANYGLAFNNTTGRVWGTPIDDVGFHYYNYVLSRDGVARNTVEISAIRFYPAGTQLKPIITNRFNLPHGIENQYYDQQLEPCGDGVVYIPNSSNDIGGLTLHTDGTITGTPTSTASIIFPNVKVSVNGVVSDPVSVIIRVDEAVTPVITNLDDLPHAIQGQYYDQQLEPYGDGILYIPNSNSVLNGLTITSTGRITGTPITTASVVFPNVKVKVNNIESEPVSVIVRVDEPTTPPTPTEIKLVDSAENDLEGSAIKVITGEKTITIKDSSDAVVTGATVAYKKFNKTSGEFDTTVTPTGVSFNAATGVITFGSTKSQLVKATVSVGGSEVGSIIYIVPGDANFSGSVNDYDWQAIISRLHGSNQSADIMYGSLNLSKLMADVNSVKIENPGVNDYDWQQLISSMH